MRIVLCIVLVAAAVLGLGASPVRAQHPGENGRIALVRGTPGQQDIFLVKPDGTGLKNLTNDPGEYGAIDWGPKGSKLAFTESVGGVSEVWVMNADGTGKIRVSPAGESRGSPSWSPDGNSIVVDGNGRLYMLAATGGSETMIQDYEVAETYCDGTYELKRMFSSPSWSPLGNQLAVVVSQEFPPNEGEGICDPNPNIKIDVATISPAGGGTSLITDDGTPDFLPDFSPDGTKIVFQRGNAGITVVNAGGGGATPISPGSGGRPRWSPDGESILYVRDENQDGNLDLWTMNPDGTEREPLLQDGESNGQADWQPLQICRTSITRTTSSDRAAVDGCPFIVNSTTDRSDKKPGDKKCSTGKKIDGVHECTLRAAIQEANTTTARNRIHFGIEASGAPRIRPKKELPTITEPVTIVGGTQPGTPSGSPGVELDGTGLGRIEGLTIAGKNSEVTGLAIGNFGQAGIYLIGNKTTLTGNYIGTDATGQTRAPNRYGVIAESSGGNTIGGESPSERNVISGNDIAGLFLERSSNNNVISGNYIGIDAAAEHALGNGTGIVLRHSNANTVGGLIPGAANVVSGNEAFGIELISAAKNNEVVGNYVGTDPETSVLAVTDFGNGQHGIFLHGRANNNMIGGTAPGAGNVVNNNGNVSTGDGGGILLSSTFANTVQGNSLGFDPDGTYAAEFVGNASFGVIVSGTGDKVGGSAAGAGNTIGWNGSGGMALLGEDNVMEGNTFKGSPTSNDPAATNPVAIIVGRSAATNRIGGTEPGQGNDIQSSYISGIAVEPEARLTLIHGNNISSAGAGGGVGIDLLAVIGVRGVTPNDTKDQDLGPNGLQNFPVLSSALRGPSGVEAEGTIQSSPNTAMTIEFFVSQSCSPAGNGPGERYLARTTVTTDANGNAPVSMMLTSDPSLGSFITATATSGEGTSEFSNCVIIP